jgi:hypothetical protein
MLATVPSLPLGALLTVLPLRVVFERLVLVFDRFVEVFDRGVLAIHRAAARLLRRNVAQLRLGGILIRHLQIAIQRSRVTRQIIIGIAARADRQYRRQRQRCDGPPNIFGHIASQLGLPAFCNRLKYQPLQVVGKRLTGRAQP